MGELLGVEVLRAHSHSIFLSVKISIIFLNTLVGKRLLLANLRPSSFEAFGWLRG